MSKKSSGWVPHCGYSTKKSASGPSLLNWAAVIIGNTTNSGGRHLARLLIIIAMCIASPSVAYGWPTLIMNEYMTADDIYKQTGYKKFPFFQSGVPILDRR